MAWAALLLALLPTLSLCDPQWIWRAQSPVLSPGVVCVDVQLRDPRQITIACPSDSAYIDSVEFASVGQPQGGCELPVASQCHSDSFSALLGDLCLGRNNCTVYSEHVLANTNLSCTRALRALALVHCADTRRTQAVPSHTIDLAADPAPTNTFTYFRTALKIPQSANDLYISVAADSNAAVFVDGKLLSRKLTRYKENFITADRYVIPKDSLGPGLTTFVFRHFSWGNVETFQRTGETHAGLFVNSNFGLESGASGWQYLPAPEYLVHSDQVIGVAAAGGAHRIRFPQIVDGPAMLPSECFVYPFEGCPGEWQTPTVVTSGLWPPGPPAETEASLAGRQQSGTLVAATSVLAAGSLQPDEPISSDPYSIAKRIGSATYQRDAALTAAVSASLIAGTPARLSAPTGSSLFVTVDFQQPRHGYPVLLFGPDTTAGVVVDFGYTEKAFDLYSGDDFVKPTGWINPEGIVGTGYADRFRTRDGAHSVELPDERTARWMTLNIHFPFGGVVSLEKIAFQTWMFPAEAGPANGMGYFECGDSEMDAIVNLSLIHAGISMSDTYVDCPGREDGQWIEDARPRALISAAWFNDVSLRQTMVRHMAEMQNPDGTMHPFPPSNYPAVASVDWSVQWVAAMYDDYVFTGSTALIVRFWDNLVKYWNNVLAGLRPDGMWTGTCLNDIRITPNCQPGAVACSSGMITPWIIERLQFSAAMATAAGHPDMAQKWTAAASAMASAFQRFHVVPAAGGRPAYVSAVTGLARDGSWEPSPVVMQAAQTVAVFTGLVNASLAGPLLDYAFPGPDGSPRDGVLRWNNPSYLRRVLKALSFTNRTARAIAHLKERFSQYLPGNKANPTAPALQGPLGGPLPEYWISRVDLSLKPGQTNNAQPVDGTGSHGWAAVALLWMHAELLGVTEHGLPPRRTIHVAPDDGGVNGVNLLPFVRGRTFTSRGAVDVDWQPSTGTLSITLPASNTESSIYRPQSCRGPSLHVTRKPAGGSVVRASPTLVIVLGAGDWQFTC